MELVLLPGCVSVLWGGTSELCVGKADEQSEGGGAQWGSAPPAVADCAAQSSLHFPPITVLVVGGGGAWHTRVTRKTNRRYGGPLPKWKYQTSHACLDIFAVLMWCIFWYFLLTSCLHPLFQLLQLSQKTKTVPQLKRIRGTRRKRGKRMKRTRNS